MTNARCLAVITARGGSKGVPDKNVRDLGGLPVIEYTCQVALSCPHITHTVVTTDSPRIREIALAAGVEAPFLRPPELATDTARQEDAILHAMAWYEERGERFDLLCLLEPTTPLRQVATLSRGFELLAATSAAGAVFSVVECEFSPVFCSPLRADGYMRDWMDDKYKWLNRQEIPVFYQPSPLVTISRWSTFKEKRTFMHDTTLAMEVDQIEARDVDSPLDFFVVERLVERGFFRSGQLDAYVGKKG